MRIFHFLILSLVFIQILPAIGQDTAASEALVCPLSFTSPTTPEPRASMSYPIHALYWVYRNTASSTRGAACNFTPSCSHYSEQAIMRYGFFRGFVMTGDRLLRCNLCINPLQYPRGLDFAQPGRVIIDPVEDHDVWQEMLDNQH